MSFRHLVCLVVVQCSPFSDETIVHQGSPRPLKSALQTLWQRSLKEEMTFMEQEIKVSAGHGWAWALDKESTSFYRAI